MNEIIREISPNDVMYNPKYPEHYFQVGYSGLDMIKNGLMLANIEKNKIKRILDMPCGHGRVLRTIKSYFPSSQIVSCDLDKDAVDFCHKVFDTIPVYSSKQIDKIQLIDKFDLIWCGSLFTHLDEHRWKPFMEFFNSHLENGGLFIFTVHGRYVNELMIRGETYGLSKENLEKLLNDFKKKGFGCGSYENDDYYGISASLPSFVLSILENLQDLRLLYYTERGWDNHQDVICCIKES